jgi:hypothetical protein
MNYVPGKTRVVLAIAACGASLLGVHAVVADAPAGHFNVDDDIVLDTQTKLSWQRAVSNERLGAADAAAYCTELELAGPGWRLPTIKELHTLVDETRTQPAIDTAIFPKTPASFIWTSSRVSSFQQYLWAVNFAEGTDAWFTEETPRYVRCVR